jgi:DNA-binding transcriptional regulator YiaG
MSKTYTISDLAQEFGVTTRTLRHYEDQGRRPAKASIAFTRHATASA